MKVAAIVIEFLLRLAAGLLIYMTVWAVQYRIHHAAVPPVDMRRSESDIPYVIQFRASLASNPHGFPGHAYIVWSNGTSAGYVPRYATDQLPSLFHPVRGTLQLNGIRDNSRNLSSLTVLLSKPDFDRAAQLARHWNTNSFQVGKRDCVRFVSEIASTIGLRCPDPSYQFPQDYVERLKQLNTSRSPLHDMIVIERAPRTDNEVQIHPARLFPFPLPAVHNGIALQCAN